MDFKSLLSPMADLRIPKASSSVFCLSSAKLPQLVLSSGISVLSYHFPLTYLKKSSFGVVSVSMKSILIPGVFSISTLEFWQLLNIKIVEQKIIVLNIFMILVFDFRGV